MNRVPSLVALSLALVGAWLACAAPARADATSSQACISEAAKAQLTNCPSGAQARAAGTQPHVTLPARVPEPPKTKTPTGAGAVDIGEVRDPRQIVLKQRTLALLVTEIQQMESLLKSTGLQSRDRPMLLRRLAEDYVELENAAAHEMTVAAITSDQYKATNPRLAGQWQATVNARKVTMERARKAAIAAYTSLVTDYAGQPSSNFPANPPAPYALLDEAYYYLAYEYEQSGDTTNARRVYLDLITRTPGSRYVPNSYLAFGELFYGEALTDPAKWEPARQAYVQVVRKPPPDNKVYGYAWYKLAYVFWNLGDLPHALEAFKKTIDFGAQYPTLHGAPKLAEGARRDIVVVYALAGSPTEAYGLFRNVSGDAAGSSARTFQMMDDLGQSYLDTGHYPEAIALYKDLEVRDAASDKACEYQSHITEATLALRSGDKRAMVDALSAGFKTYAQFAQAKHADDAKNRCANRTAALATETAMAWHLEAVGSPGQRGTGDGVTLDLASRLYRQILQTWDAATYAKFQFPRLVRADWPTILGIQYDLADLLYVRERWAECGPAFDAVVAADPKGADAASAAYAAAICYQNVYLGQRPAGADRRGSGELAGDVRRTAGASDEAFAPKDLTSAQRAMVQSFDRYVCAIQPDKGDAAGQKRLVEIEYARCRLYYEAHHWQEAAACFRAITYDHPDDESAVYASQLYLESVHALWKHGGPAAASCVDDIAADTPKFLDMFCAGDKTRDNAEVCTVLAKVQCDVERARAQRIVEQAGEGGDHAIDLFERGGKAYFAIWEKYGAAPLRRNEAPQCERLDEVVENAARAFTAAHLVASAIRARMVLLDPQMRMDRTELAKDAKLRIGRNWQPIAVYDQAADFYERYAKEEPHRRTCVGGDACGADRALSDAVALRLGLGQEDQAVADVARYQRDYGSVNATDAAQIALAIGVHDADKSDWPGARRALAGAMRVLDRAPLDLQVQAHATYARALTHLQPAQAAAEYARVRAIWGDGAAVASSLGNTYEGATADDLAHKLGKTLDAVGEAMFFAADADKHDRVDALPIPLYKGPRTKDDIKRFMDATMMPWARKKQAAIEAVDKEYQRITELRPVPPPRWVIAAASRGGMMWGDFVDDFRKAPYPREWDQPGFVPGTADTLRWTDLRSTYVEGVARASEPFKRDKAKPALERCLGDSVSYQYFDERSRDCERWLGKNYKDQYHVVDELRGAPTQSSGGLDDRPPPLVVGAKLWHPLDVGAVRESVDVLGAQRR